MGGGKVIECNTKGEWDQHMSSGKTVRLQLCHMDAWPVILRVVPAFRLLSVPECAGAGQLQLSLQYSTIGVSDSLHARTGSSCLITHA
jgi:hypothetical protein